MITQINETIVAVLIEVDGDKFISEEQFDSLKRDVEAELQKKLIIDRSRILEEPLQE